MCPVASPMASRVAQVATYAMPAATSLSRAHKHRYAGDSMTPAGAPGDSRFSPLPEVAHAYVARHSTCALLETAFRHVTSGNRTIYWPNIEPWAVSAVATRELLDLADLRDPELDRMGISRGSLVAAPPRHHACTRQWARALHDAGYDGIIWHSRQADLHRAHVAAASLAAQLLEHTAIEVAVVWSPPAPVSPFRPVGSTHRLVDQDGDVAVFVYDWASLLGVAVEV